jgi:hypothetical protein
VRARQKESSVDLSNSVSENSLDPDTKSFSLGPDQKRLCLIGREPFLEASLIGVSVVVSALLIGASVIVSLSSG